ncbi:MAG TPA: GspE/PulE family protein [Baekduia sp.]|nr:GspE/PulE family protein [Baekduia sp.]
MPSAAPNVAPANFRRVGMATPAHRSHSLTIPGLTPPRARIRSSQMLGQVAVDLGYATREAVERSAARAREHGRVLGRQLLDDGVLTPAQLARVLAERFGLDHVDLGVFPVDPEAAALISHDAARRYGAVPVHVDPDGTLLVASAEPTNVLALDDLAMLTGRPVRPAVAAADELQLLLERLAPARLEHDARDAARDTPERRAPAAPAAATAGADDAPVVRLVDSILKQAVAKGASDVHFDPESHDMHVRMRVDGMVGEPIVVPGRLAPGVVARLKVISGLDIAERRAPQDGRAALAVSGREVDVRIVTLPVVHGEAAVVRVLDPLGAPKDLSELGLREPELGRLQRALSHTAGGIVVAGPTGSGKTTTLYAALAQRHQGTETVITIEDPVEYRLEGVKQISVNPKAGVTFATGLRSIVRADPDVIMVGEVRDRDTARIAVEAALTGHLVLSTLHARDAPSALTRMLEMGVEPFLLASAMDCIVSQRLLRRLCEQCRRPARVTAELLRQHGLPAEDDVDCFEAVGCARCSGSGHRGRLAVYEALVLDEPLRALVLEHASADEIAAAAVAGGMRRLASHALDEVAAGRTSAAEASRVLGGTAL